MNVRTFLASFGRNRHACARKWDNKQLEQHCEVFEFGLKTIPHFKQCAVLCCAALFYQERFRARNFS